MTLPKLKSAWYSNRGCFSQGLCRICWMVPGSAINRSVSVFNPIASIKTQKDICKTRLLPGEKAWPRLLRYFSQSWCWALCRISLSRLSCSLKFALVFYILLQGCFLWSPSCYVAAKFKEERRERYLLFSFAPLPFCRISRWRPKNQKNTKIQLNISKSFPGANSPWHIACRSTGETAVGCSPKAENSRAPVLMRPPEEQHIIGEVQKGAESGKVSVQFPGGHGGIWRFALSALTLWLERDRDQVVDINPLIWEMIFEWDGQSILWLKPWTIPILE